MTLSRSSSRIQVRLLSTSLGKDRSGIQHYTVVCWLEESRIYSLLE